MTETQKPLEEWYLSYKRNIFSHNQFWSGSQSFIYPVQWSTEWSRRQKDGNVCVCSPTTVLSLKVRPSSTATKGAAESAIKLKTSLQQKCEMLNYQCILSLLLYKPSKHLKRSGHVTLLPKLYTAVVSDTKLEVAFSSTLFKTYKLKWHPLFKIYKRWKHVHVAFECEGIAVKQSADL